MMMDPCEIANFLANELFMQQLVPLDGIQSGVPTRTTPTVTPTTLRNIEQTLLDWSSEIDRPASIPCQAGFVPPLAPIHFIDNNDNNSIESSESESQPLWHTPLHSSIVMHEDNSLALTDSSSVATLFSSNNSPSLPVATSTAISSIPIASTTGLGISHTLIPVTAYDDEIDGTPSSPLIPMKTKTTTGGTRKNTGGRRPNKSTNLSPEEEEKRQVRRERNKLAAARCRKRRVDQTNELVEKVEQLEKEKLGLHQKLEELQRAADELKLFLQSHATCKLTSSQQQSQLNRATTIASSSTATARGIKRVAMSQYNDDVEDVVYNVSRSIKREPNDSLVDSLDGPPSPKRLMLSSNNPVVPTIPKVISIPSSIPTGTSMLNTPTIPTPPMSIPVTTIKPKRPSSLNVPLTMTPSQSLGLKKSVTDITGVPITTPSSGFNFDSLMDGGTGLTPIATPLMPTCSSQNKHPLELVTPTSEPSKLVSL